jgi:cupin fold WbuC family metalloprotein
LFKDKTIQDNLQRIRLCSHKDVNDVIHEMIIALKKTTYIRPHKHINRLESFHVLEGKASVVIFHDDGKIKDVIDMGDYKSGKKFYYKMFKPYYHTVLVNSDFLIFQEVTNGPFKKSDTEYASWAPEESDKNFGKKYIERLKKDIMIFSSKQT